MGGGGVLFLHMVGVSDVRHEPLEEVDDFQPHSYTECKQ